MSIHCNILQLQGAVSRFSGDGDNLSGFQLEIRKLHTSENCWSLIFAALISQIRICHYLCRNRQNALHESRAIAACVGRGAAIEIDTREVLSPSSSPNSLSPSSSSQNAASADTADCTARLQGRSFAANVASAATCSVSPKKSRQTYIA